MLGQMWIFFFFLTSNEIVLIRIGPIMLGTAGVVSDEENGSIPALPLGAV